MLTIYICRHGKTEYNIQKRLQGWIDTPLVEEGVDSAHNIATKIKNIHFDELYSSDLGRAFTTAYIISRDILYSNDIFLSSELRERSFGELSGIKIEEAEMQYPKLDEVDFIPPQGESLLQTKFRVLKFISNLEIKYPNCTVLLVSHDIVINALYSEFADIDFGKYNKKHYNPHDFLA